RRRFGGGGLGHHHEEWHVGRAGDRGLHGLGRILRSPWEFHPGLAERGVSGRLGAGPGYGRFQRLGGITASAIGWSLARRSRAATWSYMRWKAKSYSPS